MISRVLTICLSLALAGTGLANADRGVAAEASPPGVGHDFVVTNDGTYIWFNDERAVVSGRTLMAGYVTSEGTTAITSVDLATGARIGGDIPLQTSSTGDDHANPAILRMSEDRVGVFYTGHDWGSRPNQYYRISTKAIPTSLKDFGKERVTPTPTLSTYNNPYQLGAEDGRIYNFFRQGGDQFYYATYSKAGALETAPRQLLTRPQNWMFRPYGKFSSNGQDRIDMFFTDGHPTMRQVSLYHAYYQDGNLYRSDGSLIGNLAKDAPFNVKDFSQIYRYSAEDDWTPWNHEIKPGPDGQPVVVYSRQLDRERLEYWYAAYDPTRGAWARTRIASAGRAILADIPIDPVSGERTSATQPHYAGGVAINPGDVNEVFISANINPITKAKTAKFEIYRGRLTGGAFTWTALTRDSAENNYRPFVPTGATRDDQVVIWFTGRYETFVNKWRSFEGKRHFYKGYDTRIVGRYLNRAPENVAERYAIDVNGDKAITAPGHLPLAGSGKAPLVTQRATVAVVNSKGSRERARVSDPVLRDFGFASGHLDASISGLNPGVYRFDVANYDTWNKQNVAMDFFAAGTKPTRVVGAHSQSDRRPATFYARVDPGAAYTLRLQARGGRAAVLNGLTMTRLSDDAAPIANFQPGATVTVPVGTRRTFDGGASADPHGRGLTYAWRSTGLSGVASRKATFARTFTATGRVGVELTVTDARGRSSKQHVNIIVTRP